VDAADQLALAAALQRALGAVGWELAQHAQEGGQGYYPSAPPAAYVRAVGRIYSADLIMRRIEAASSPRPRLFKLEGDAA